MNLASLYNIQQTKPAVDDVSNISFERHSESLHVVDHVEWIENTTASCLILLGLLSICCNGLTINVITNTPSLRTLSNTIIVSLAGVDVLVGLGMVVLGVVTMPKNHEADHNSLYYGCFSFSSFLIGVIIISVLHLMFIAIERYVYITMPFFYIAHVNMKAIACAIIPAWIIGFIFFILPLIIKHPIARVNCNPMLNMPIMYNVLLNFIGLVAGIVSVVMYVKIWETVQKQRNTINAQSQSWGSTSEGRPSGGAVYPERNRKSIQMENRSSKNSQPDASHERNNINAQSLPSRGWTLVKGIFGGAKPAERDMTFIQIENRSSKNSQPDTSQSISEKGGSTGRRSVAEILAPGRTMMSSMMRRSSAAPNQGSTRKTIRSIKLFTFISCSFVICMLPNSLLTLAVSFNVVTVPTYVDSILSIIALSSSALNFFIFMRLNSKFRMVVYKILRFSCTQECRASKDDPLYFADYRESSASI